MFSGGTAKQTEAPAYTRRGLSSCIFGGRWYTKYINIQKTVELSMKNTYYTISKVNIVVMLSAALMLCGAIVRIVYYTGVRASAGEIGRAHV